MFSPSSRRNLIGALSGNFLEYYDVTLYGFFSALLGPIFFPTQDPFVTSLLTLTAFAMGYLARPFGGMFFGYLGDKFGRKKALSLAVILVTIPTFAIGLMPTYEEIGIFAPLLVLLCRILQGICTGGEYPGAAVFIAEHSGPRKKALLCSLVPASSLLGAITGTLIGALFVQEAMPYWGWRIPFLVGGLLGLIAFILRRQISETHVFETLSDATKSPNPIWNSFKSHTPLILGTALIGAGTLVPFNLVMVYMSSFMEHKTLSFSASESLLMTSGLMALLMCFLPIWGALAQKWGRQKMMISACVLTAVVAYPLFYLSHHAVSFSHLLIYKSILVIISAGFVAPTVSYFTDLFPPQNRYTALGFSIALGEGVGGGTTPLIATYLTHATQNPLSPSFYLIFSSLVSILGIVVIARTVQKRHGSQQNL
ncbi:MAG: MFS transporter [Alphaproteobacteria bacterium]|nr:MFS transporter [Alphaproteobacteria bacterium]